MENECERVDESRPIENSVNPTNSAEKLPARRAGIRFTSDEDNYIRLGIKKFGLSWSKILRDPEFHFNSCRVPISKYFEKASRSFKISVIVNSYIMIIQQFVKECI